MDVNNVAAIVTGGASGLGGATAEMLAKRGAKVTIFDVNEELGKSHAEKIGASFQRVDVTDEASVVAGLEAAEKANGPARILVNCAGIVHGGRVVSKGAAHPIAAYRRTIEINLIGTFQMLSQFAAKLIAAGVEPLGEERGVIISTASVAAFDGQIGQAAYSSSKGGIVGMTLPVARDLAQYAIRVMTIAPGLFVTPMMASLPPEVQKSLGEMTPFPSRLGTAEEYAQLVESIIANPMLNGETIRLDGAVRLTPR
jgi:NAD(P)-dependent dehydrogenase (short-subunit alcohol dehydrogenase family)